MPRFLAALNAGLTVKRDGLTLANVRSRGQKPGYGSRCELNQRGLTVAKVIEEP